VNALREHFAASLRLHFRNRLALIYGYLFPLIFLAAFWVLYRFEKVPLLRHMGELLTVGVLGGACFGLPTSLVGDRERGVWRRYRLTPIPTWMLVANAVLVRFLLVMSAGALQLAVAMAVGMTPPEHPVALLGALALVSFAFIGLGLVIAALADNVPAVQALGQCVFLPMLIIGGVAVSLASLPEWAQHLSAFFPGRYAVAALQACVNGGGFAAGRFDWLALLVIGGAACVAGARLFRWDAGERFAARAGKGWLLAVAGAWLAMGFFAERRGRALVPPSKETAIAIALATAAAKPPTSPTNTLAPTAPTPGAASAPASVPVPVAPPPKPEPPWKKITEKDVAAIDFRVPPDNGVVSPFASEDEDVQDFIKEQLDIVRAKLPDWQPGLEPDDLRAVRNLLLVAAIPDAIQMPVERYLPPVVLDHLKERFPKEDLIKMLTWIIQHPYEGTILDQVEELGIQGTAGDPEVVRERVYLYAVKFVARLRMKRE
jgi:ABC-2 type transport system permease protein